MGGGQYNNNTNNNNNDPTTTNEMNHCDGDRRGLISGDGMHWCETTMGPRTNGGILCLVQCTLTYNSETNNDYYYEQLESLHQCQNQCNALYADLNTIFVLDNDDDQTNTTGHLVVEEALPELKETTIDLA